tara:strand:- start:8975 stop:9604 length:630 start_codon:yes stop_codon:yes gene_type:complete
MPDINTILDAGNFAEEVDETFETETSDLTSSHEPTPSGMNFTVKMDGYTLGDFEQMVVETAARILLDKGASDDRISKIIQDRAIDLITSKVDGKLLQVTAGILDRPMMQAGKDALSIGEYIQLVGKDYLTANVDREGRIATGFHNNGEPRIQRLVNSLVDISFKSEIKAQMAGITSELRKAAAAQVAAVIEEERHRLQKALTSEVGKRR